MNEIAQAKAQVRLQNWQMMYSEYANSGMTVKEWCENNNLSVKTFYYRLKRIRMETLNREHHDIVALGNTGDNKITEDGFGVHTFELTIPSITKDEFERIVNCAGKAYSCNDGNSIFIYPERHGIRFFLNHTENNFYNNAMRFLIASSNIKQKAKAAMLEYADVQCRKQSHLSAKKHMSKALGSKSKLKKMYNNFDMLKVYPISVSYRDKHGCKPVPGLYRIMDI